MSAAIQNHPRRMLIASVGSYGDVFPFLALGERLKARGHDVTLLTSGYFTKLVEDAGLKMAPVGTPEQYQAYITDPNLLHPLRGFMLTRRMLSSIVKPIYEYLRDEWQNANTLIVSSPYCMASRIAEETLNIPLVTVCPAPIAMGSVVDPPVVSPLLSPSHVPRMFRKLFGQSVNWMTDRTLGSPINKFRKQLGQSKMHSLMHWWHARRGTISLFPEWFAPASIDWPSPHTYAGFPLCTPRNVVTDRNPVTAAKLDEILSSPKRPLLFYPGSNASHLRQYFEICEKVCQQMGRSGILVAPAAIDLGDQLSSHLLVVPFVSMNQTLPQVAAAIHHGGIGTIAACISAGVPQLIRPMVSDQPDNAARVARLGVGSWLSNARFRVADVTRALEPLIGDPLVASRCQLYRERMQATDGLTIAADLIESLA